MSLITHLVQKVGQAPSATKPVLLPSNRTFTQHVLSRQLRRAEALLEVDNARPAGKA
jgi:hypothetical protein